MATGKWEDCVNWAHLGTATIGGNEPLPMNLLGATSPRPSPPLRGGEGEASPVGSRILLASSLAGWVLSLARREREWLRGA